jgi:predicted outer membrane repeat protein
MMNKNIRVAGLVLVLGLLLTLGNWQRQGKAAGQQGDGSEPPEMTAAATTPFVPEPRQTPAAVAGTITVTSNQDGAANAANCPGPNCRLRDAIAKAVAGDTINFSVTGTITLNSGELSIDKNLTINGPGAAQLTISGNNASRVFVNGSLTALNGLTIANGNNTFGGGIRNLSNLTMTNCTISGNSGNGIRNEDLATLTITNSTISGNSDSGILNAGTLTLTNSTVSGNSGALGGGIDSIGTAVLTNCTFSGNTAGGFGGGIYAGAFTNDVGTTTMTNCTISGNTAAGDGGGVYADVGNPNLGSNNTVTMTNCTIFGNSAGAGNGGGIYIKNSILTVKARNTIIAGNTDTGAREDVFGRLTSQGHNLIGVIAGAPLQGDTTGNLLNVNAVLSPLANNGGPTQTQALAYCSPTINAGADVTTLNGAINNSATTITLADATAFPAAVGFVIRIDSEQMIVTGKTGNQLTVTRAANSTAAAAHSNGAGVNPAFDQRGASFSRRFGSAPDIGAFEWQGEVPAPIMVTNNNDSGPGSLREALATANQCSTISFASGISLITLTSAELVIDKTVTINGPGANLLTISGNGGRRVFTINSGENVALNGLTIANGAAGSGRGGGINNFASLTLNNCTISGNSANLGGGICNDGSGSLALSNCTLSGNSALTAGGIYNIGSGISTLTNCTLSGNVAAANGGGIFNNRTGSTLTLTNCTLSGNSANRSGGIVQSAGLVRLKNTLIAGNTASTSSPDIDGIFTSQGYNLIGMISDATITPTTGDQIGTAAAPINPLLGALANNGGPTQTRALLPGSPARNAGDNCVTQTSGCLAAPLTTDQRGTGFNRLVGSAVDIGAVEMQHDTPILTINPATLPDSAVGSAYNQTLSATGGSGNYSFSILSGVFPPGLSLSATGQISGQPASGGTFSFIVMAFDSTLFDAYGTRTYTITISSVCATAPSGLVDWWQAEGNANDAVGGNHGTLNGSAAISTAAEGQVGRAFKFDGTNGYVALPDNLFPFPTSGTGTTPFSFELWFKSGYAGGVILGQQDVAPYNASATHVPAIYVGTDGLLRVMLFWNGTPVPLTIASTVNDNLTFHHLAVTYNGTQQSIYLDGQFLGSRAQTQTAYSTSYKYQLGTGNTNSWPGGSSANGGWFNFTGLIDEPSLYNRALTLQEVQALFAAGRAGKCPNSAPTFTPAAAISRQQGTPAGAAVTVGTVSDGQTAAGSLTVTQITGGTATGITVTGITNTNGTITATVSASCSATAGTVRFQVSDGSLTGTGDLQVNITANTAPTLTYGAASANTGGSTTNSPTATSDNGSITGYVVQSQGTYTGTISVNSSGVVSFSNAAPVGNHTITIRATDNCGATTDALFMLTVNNSNTAPTFTPATAISRQQGSPAGAAVTVGTVSDAQTAAGSLTVTQIAGGTATGITVNGITNTGGTVTAIVSASCSATAGTVRFQVSDGSLTGTGNLQVNITANTAPTLTYGTASANTGGSTTNSPTTATDNGSITGYVVQSQGTYTGTISVNASGVVSFSNAAPAGNHTITIRATDNCGTTTNAQFTLTVSACAATLSKTTQNFAANGGTGTFTLTINPACQWTAVSNDPGFITIVSPTGQQTGPGTVTFSVASHTSTTPRNGTIIVAGQTFNVRQGMQFLDVPVGTNFYEEIGKLSAVGITLGCGQGNYCPDSSVTRQQMAAFLSRALGVFNPPTPGAQRFADVLPDNPFYAFIEELAVRQITLGCGGGNYCPDSSVTREQMAAFVIRALHEPGYVPPTPGMQRFADVPPDNPFYRHIEEMAVRQITLGCGGSNYCPTANVTRGQMAAFLVRAFGL